MLPARGHKRHNLSVQRTRLIGREHDEATVRRVLLDSDGRMVTLIGAGGCGKTRLALAVAADLVDDFADGVWLVELAPLADPTLIPQAVATALGVREQPAKPIMDTLLVSMKSRQLLLVLDNCEHLVEACAHLADSVVGGCLNVRLLATSREPLRVQGEMTWRVPSLGVPDLTQTHTLDELASSPAVQLFMDRAKAVRPAFVLNENAPTVVQICRYLDGLPLGIELAAAQLRALGVEQILERLQASHRLLVGGSRTAPDRQQTLKATLDWSHALLTPPERVVFRRLAVFVGGWSLEAAEAVCAGGEIEDVDVVELLSRLIDKSLVVMEERAGRARYRLLEPIRQYAQERLDVSDELAVVQERLATHFDVFAGQSAHTLQRDVGLELQEPEQDNLRAALRWCLDHAAVDVGLRLARHCTYFWDARSMSHEAQAWLSQLLALPGPERPTDDRAAVLGYSGNLATRYGDFAAGRALHEQGLATARVVGDAFQLFNNLNDAGTGAVYRGEYALAQAHLEESVATARAAVDQAGDAAERRRMQACEAEGMSRLSWLANLQADYATARFHAEAALSLARTVGEPWLIARALNMLGDAFLGEGDIAAARSLLEESLTMHQQVSERWITAYTLDHLARVALTEARHPEAQTRFAESLMLRQEAGDVAMIARSLEGMAALAAARAEPERAVRLAGAADALRQTIGAPLHPQDRVWRDRWLEPVRSVVEEETVRRAWTSGEALSMEQALDLALLNQFEPAPARSTRSDAARATPVAPLSAREQEVAALVAQGLGNRQIAECLVITERTVAAHIEHILHKLGFTSRTQVGVWAAEHGLVAPSRA